MEEYYNPYNEKNIEINDENINMLLERFNIFYKINNNELFKRAFIHRSYVKSNLLELNLVKTPFKCIELKQSSNERLEFLGDGVLECITKMYLYKRFPDADEGFMTEKKICLVKNDHIGKLAYKMGLNKWFIISKNAEEKKIRSNYKKLGCLFEAFLGALFLDANQIKIDDNSNLFNNYSNEEFEKEGTNKFRKRFIFSICPENFITTLDGYITEKIYMALSNGNIPIYYGKLDEIDKKIFNINRILWYNPLEQESIQEIYEKVLDLINDKKKLFEFYKQPPFLETAIDILDTMETNYINTVKNWLNIE